MSYKPVFHVFNSVLDSFFYACSAIMDRLLIVSFFLGNITKSSIIVDYQVKFVLVQANLLVKVIATLCVMKPCTCSYKSTTLCFLIPRSCAYLDSLGEFVFWAKCGLQNNCGVRVCDFRLQNEARSQS